jgi:ubiquinone/menaquinone biosynthesis C-methylase UbiE
LRVGGEHRAEQTPVTLVKQDLHSRSLSERRIAFALGGCETGCVDDAELLAEQVAYYRARAPRYDEWWQRRGPYDRGPEVAAEWDRQMALVEDALTTFSVRGRVLELAGGTGWWTGRLARCAESLTVVDSSPEALEINRERTARADVDYQVADVFSWFPDGTYDVVFFSFWLSHVPRQRCAAFWSMVRSFLSPGGRVFLIDNHDDPVLTGIKDPYVLKYLPDRHVRRLPDGREYNVVKVMYEPDELEAQLEEFGWTAQINATRWFLFGSARPD